MPEPDATNPVPDSHSEPPPPTTPTDFDRSAWLCLECDYSLAHTKEDRCPECGTAFSAERYAAMYAGRPIPSFPWDHGHGFANWWQTARIVLLRPSEFRERISASPDGQAAFVFACLTYAAMFVVVNGAVAIADLMNEQFSTLGSKALVRRMFALSIPWPVALCLGERALVTLAGGLIRARGQINSVALWAVVFHYHSAFALSVGAIVGVTALSARTLGLLLSDFPEVLAAAHRGAGLPALAIALFAVFTWQDRVEKALSTLRHPRTPSFPWPVMIRLLVTALSLIHLAYGGLLLFRTQMLLRPELTD